MAIRYHRPEETAAKRPKPEAIERHERIMRKVSEALEVARALDALIQEDEPKKARQSNPQSIRFPQEVLDYFGYKTPGWNTRINQILLAYVRAKQSG